MLNWLGMEVLDGVPNSCVRACPGLMNLCRLVNALPAVEAWIAAGGAAT